MSDELTVSTGDLTTSDVMLNIGPQHPATHGVLRLALSLDGDRIVRAEPRIGYMHRGAEKLFEARDYRQIMVLANRHDWLSAFSNELGVALAVERMLGIEVPVRAVWARTLLAELNRVLSHLMFLANLPTETTETATAGYAARESIQAVMEEASGGRMHYMFNRLGGLKEDLPDGWLSRVATAVEAVRRSIAADFVAVVRGDETFRSRCRGLGILDLAAAKAFGVSGPVGWASGVDLDLRRDDPYLGYGELPTELLPSARRVDGDCLARFECLLDSTESALGIAAHCVEVLENLEAGPINVRLPKVVKAPEGETYVWTENPLGITGYYLVSRGERTPWRLKLRTPSFNNVQALPAVLADTHVGELITVLSSLFFVIGDLDK